jgi:hypothetical protein
MREFARFTARAVQSQPLQSLAGGAMTICGVNYDDWLKHITGDVPPWAQNHLFQLGIISLGVLILAYVFWHQAEVERKVHDRPDENGIVAIKKLLTRSKRGAEMIRSGELRIQMMYESMLTPEGVIEQRLQARLLGELEDRLRQGLVLAWGQHRSSNKQRLIDKEEWDRLNLLTEESDLYPAEGAGNLCCNSKTHGIEYWQIFFSSANLYREFPLRWLPRRIDYVPLRKPYKKEV